MVGKARTLFLGLDACDRGFATALAASGDMPNLAELLRDGVAASYDNERGYFVGAVWPTIMTGHSVDQHLWYSGTLFRPQDYTYEGCDVGKTLWDRCCAVGQRVAVFDAPHAPVVPGLNGLQVCEWGAHDHLYGTAAWPPELLAELDERYGPHPIGTTNLSDDPRHSPCDFVHRKGRHRTVDEQVALYRDLLAGLELKTSASLDLLDRGGWDLFYSVLGESHCVGHQLWYLHDRAHERFDPRVLDRLGVDDPMAEIYRRLDRAVGAHLERLDDDATAYVLLSHGMAARTDANHLLSQILRRLHDAYEHETSPTRGPRIGRADQVLHPLPARLRADVVRVVAPILRPRLAAKPVPPPLELQPLAEQLFFPIDNHSVVGAIRLNLHGREGRGLLAPGDADRVMHWLAHRLRELVNVETGSPLVRGVFRSADLYPHDRAQVLPDLLIEWNDDRSVQRVWSPATGVIDMGYGGVRTGDHTRGGLLIARGRDIEPGESTITPIDIVPTVAASLGVPTPDLHGAPIASLLPREAQIRHRETRADRRTLDEYTRAIAAMGAVDAAVTAADIMCVSEYVAMTTVPSTTKLSVIVPTRNRPDLVARAIESILDQSYPNFEVVVVDDASNCDESRHAADERVRWIRLDEHRGVSAARNRGLDEATGDIMLYLDDDNTFSPHWLKAVAWAFGQHPPRTMVYGARVIDDVGRHFGRAATGERGLQLLRWSRALQLMGNLVDMNVVAHRRCDERFDESLGVVADWDLVLQLTQSDDPIRLPVIAAHYTTTARHRLSDAGEEVWHREKALVHNKWRTVVVP